MQWGGRIRWRELAVITLLKPGEMIPKMGSQDRMVERDYKHLLIQIAHHKMMHETNDGMLEWLANVIKKAWLDQAKYIPMKNIKALKLKLHCRLQQIPRKAARPLKEEF